MAREGGAARPGGAATVPRGHGWMHGRRDGPVPQPARREGRSPPARHHAARASPSSRPLHALLLPPSPVPQAPFVPKPQLLSRARSAPCNCAPPSAGGARAELAGPRGLQRRSERRRSRKRKRLMMSCAATAGTSARCRAPTFREQRRGER